MVLLATDFSFQARTLAYTPMPHSLDIHFERNVRNSHGDLLE